MIKQNGRFGVGQDKPTEGKESKRRHKNQRLPCLFTLESHKKLI